MKGGTRMIRKWGEIAKVYSDRSGKIHAFPSTTSMSKLVIAIERSPYATGLFAWTSMNDLCISQTYVEYPYDGPYLRIAPKENDQIEFRYVDTKVEKKQWRRTVDGVEAFVRLESFLEQLNWFTRYQMMPETPVMEREESKS
jgi:hypothetical protein